MSSSEVWFTCDEECIEITVHYEFFLSVLFSTVTILVSAFHIYMHFQNFNNPFFQSKIIVILIMAPFYCVTSVGSFVWPHLQIYFTLTRDSYQAILLFTFFYLMFSYLAYDRQKDTMEDIKVYKIMVKYQKEVHHFWPFNLCQKAYQLTHWKKAKYFTYRCKKYVLQFLVVKLASTLLMYIIYPNEEKHEFDDSYESHNKTYEVVSGIVSWVIAISASYSLYYLVLFYHALSQPLHPYSALLKFLTIKITIFFTFWQKICLTIFQEQILSGFDQEAPSYNSREIISSIENTLICFEMMIMAIAGGLAYNYQSYMSESGRNKGSFLFVLKDTIRAFKNDFRLIKPKRFGFESSHNTQIELKDLKFQNRKSVFCEIKERCSVYDSLDPDYLLH